VEMDKNNPLILYYVGYVLFRKKEIYEACQYFDRSYQLDPSMRDEILLDFFNEIEKH
jgi:uncharacterized protein HemY